MESIYTKKVVEMNYLSTDYTHRYRPILRFFYEQHGYRPYLRAEDILQHLKQYTGFETYTIHDVKKDLEVLEGWKNITSRQEANDYYSIEEFKAKRFKYQATHYTIQIERFVETLEKNQADFGGGSLDKNLFDRLLEALETLYAFNKYTLPEELYRRWEDVMEFFKRLDRKTSDYLAHISSFQAEDEMLSEAFLVRQKDFIDYLKDFVQVLQKKIPLFQVILLEKFHREWLDEIIICVAEYQLSIFRFGEKLSLEDTKKRLKEEWNSLFMWFCGEDNEARNILVQTGEIIRKILRFASRLLESKQTLRSRKQEFLELAKHFYELTAEEDAHKLASIVIGVPHTMHMSCEPYDTSGRVESLWECEEEPLELRSRRPGFRTKGKICAIANNRAKQKELLEDYIKEQERQKQNFLILIQQNQIKLDTLPILDKSQRSKVLELLNRCMNSLDNRGKTEWGQTFLWIPLPGKARISCLDGQLVAPNGVLVLQTKKKGEA
ncbi:TIGR02677 family protein [Brevibacillus brevis]|uniref:TIGR02677 family protein n=1 Tax=Brevibacillus brevis TaxID=1393 RepID=UPI000D0F2A50|nr:TIGR02677 family protein [Brevibacillus brevis]PSJ68696.1 TIGR02677 family protein [Brevibacillus brevis]RED33134.1 uncharacterized protein (TIGR02677 family) [Brevibacillus brevis]GEC93305.1 hypothetical protein BBR01nite_56360 [Brevibacillus brevis]VEF90804.1 Protein of uncharacterised function (DUF2397) [Brevibacillus brevis]